MSASYVASRVEEINRQHIEENDSEEAHKQQDSLWVEVLIAIAGGDPNASELATEALKTLDIDFSRWYA